MKTVLRLLSFLYPYRGWAALSVLLGTATIAANIGLLGTSAYLIARAALHPSIAELEVAIVGVRFFGISRSVGRYLERLVSHSVNFALLGRLRVWFYEHIEPLAPARLQDESSGDLLSRAIGDIEILQEFYVRVAAPVATAAIITAGMGIYVGLYDPILALALVSGLVLSGAGAPLLGRALAGRLSVQMIRRRGALSADIVEWLQGLADLLAFNQAGKYRERLDLDSEAFAGIQIKLGWRAALANALGLLVANLTLWLVLLLGIPLLTGRVGVFTAMGWCLTETGLILKRIGAIL